MNYVINASAWGWPEWTYVALTVVGLLVAAGNHGKPREGEYNFAMSFVGTLIILGLLIAGGFFG